MTRGLKLRLWCILCCLVAVAHAHAQVTNCCSYTVSSNGYAFIANQFDDGDTLASIFPSLPGGTSLASAGTQLYEWNCLTQAYSTYYYKTGGLGGTGWRSSTSATINAGTNSFLPGEGWIVYNNTATNYTYTICGTANSPVYPLTNFCGCGVYDLVSSQTNAAATYEDITGMSPQQGTQLFVYNSGSPFSPFPPQAPNYTVYTYLSGAWTPSAPVVGPCESVWVYTPCSNSPCMVLECPTNFSVACGTAWSFGTPSVLSNCCTNVTSVSDIVTNGTCPQFITETWLYTDACGDSSICSQTVAVVNTNPPVITCPSNVVVDSCTNWVLSYTPTATSACCTSPPAVVCSPPSPYAFPPGATNVCCTATDCCGNTTNCCFTVTVVASNCANCCSYTVAPGGYAFIANQFNNADTLNSILPNVPGGPSAATSGTVLLEYNCTNEAFSTYFYATASKTLSAGWHQVGAGNATGYTLVPGQGAVLENNTTTNYTYTICGAANSPVLPLTNFCGCGAYNLVSSQTNAPATYEEITGMSPQQGTQLFQYNSGSPTSPFPPQAPNYTVYTYLSGAWTPSAPVVNPCESVWIYTACSNSPCLVLDCPLDFGVECPSVWSFGTPSVLSNCCTNVTSVSDIVTNGACPQFITKTWLYTDACGDSSICSQSVAVVNTNLPVITCPSNIVVYSCTNWVLSYAPTATSACCTSPPAVVCSPSSPYAFPPGTTNVCCTATDCCGNSTNCCFTVTVVASNCSNGCVYVQNFNPLPPDGYVLFSGNPVYTTTTSHGIGGNASGNSDLDAYITDSAAGCTGYPSPYYLFNNTLLNASNYNYAAVVWETDSVAVTSNTCYVFSFYLANISDAINPAVIQPYIGTQALSGTASIPTAVCAWQQFSFVWNSGPNTTADLILSNQTSTGYGNDFGIDTIALCPTNCCVPPVITCASNMTVPCVNTVSFTAPTVVDTCCSNDSITVVSTVTNDACPLSITETWLITNVCGYSTTCSQTVTVVSTTPPVVLTCASNKTVVCGSTHIFDPPSVIATNPCCESVIISIVSTVTNAAICPETITRAWLATDCCGNTATCTQTVTVVSTNPVALICPPSIVTQSCTSVTLTYNTPTAVTNVCCPLVTVGCNPPSGSLFLSNSVTQVCCTATDCCGNTGSCCFNVTVEPTPSLMITCATNKTVVTPVFAYGTLRSFSSAGGDGQYPYPGVMQGTDGALYGTTEFGGTNNAGTVFKVNTDGSGYTVFYQFSNSGGEFPEAGLLEGTNGALYGTTSGGGSNNVGTVFQVNTDGTGYTVLYSFSGAGGDGAAPGAALVEGFDGALYGTTTRGGGSGDGTIFKLNPDGSGYAVLYSFLGGGGAAPSAGLLVGNDGTLYGTTTYGGSNNAGTVYSLQTSGSVYAVLYNFSSSGGDGQYPQAALMLGTDGALYGTTEFGGSNNVGTVFKLNTDGSGYTVLKSFTGPDGSDAFAGLVQANDGTLYGTTRFGGSNNVGTVFQVNTDGSGFTQVYSFSNTGGDGQVPYATLVQGSDLALYGTTAYGGSNNVGTVFRLEWSPPWDFDPPTITDSNAVLLPCPPNCPVPLNTTTNNCCPQIITRIWEITNDCHTTICTQTVTQLPTPEPIYLPNTGVNLANPKLNNTSTIDPNYTLTCNPNGPYDSQPATTAYVSRPPNPAWWANDAVSQWISPTPNGRSNDAPGLYCYQLTFTPPCTNNVVIVGKWAADNGGTITLNGHVTVNYAHNPNALPYSGSPASSYATWHAFTVRSSEDPYFVPGLNTLSFEVVNQGPGSSPTGLRVEFLPSTATCCSNCLSIQCPSNIVVSTCTNLSISYPPPVVTDCANNYTVTFTPTSPHVFPPGTNTVLCQVTDSCGNSTNCSFMVTVTNCCVTVPVNLNMTAWWPFDESSGASAAQDIAGTVDNVAVYNGHPTAELGEVNNALCFDGTNDYLVAANQAEINFNGSCTSNNAESFTIDAWIKPSPAGSSSQFLLDKRFDCGPGYALYLNSGQPGAYLSTANTVNQSSSTSGDLRDGQWHFIAVSVARCVSGLSYGTFYVDGRVAGTFTDADPGTLNNTGNLYIGRLQPACNDGGQNYMGCLDELEIFKTALSSNELAAIYNAGSSGKCRPPCPPSPPPPVIVASPTNGVAPLAVSLLALPAPCTCCAVLTNVYWSFGDGNTTNLPYTGSPMLYTYGPGAFTVTLVATDADGNSLTNIQPDLITVLTPFQSWQLQYFGCTNCAQAQPYANPTGNGQSNTNQFLAGFNPTIEAAYLQILAIEVHRGDTNGTDLNLTYLGANGDSTWSPGVASRTNILEYITGLANLSYTNGGWLPTGQTNILSGGNGLGVVTNMSTAIPIGSNAYFRVRVLLP